MFVVRDHMDWRFTTYGLDWIQRIQKWPFLYSRMRIPLLLFSGWKYSMFCAEVDLHFLHEGHFRLEMLPQEYFIGHLVYNQILTLARKSLECNLVMHLAIKYWRIVHQASYVPCNLPHCCSLWCVLYIIFSIDVKILTLRTSCLPTCFVVGVKIVVSISTVNWCIN